MDFGQLHAESQILLEVVIVDNVVRLVVQVWREFFDFRVGDLHLFTQSFRVRRQHRRIDTYIFRGERIIAVGIVEGGRLLHVNFQNVADFRLRRYCVDVQIIYFVLIQPPKVGYW